MDHAVKMRQKGGGNGGLEYGEWQRQYSGKTVVALACLLTAHQLPEIQQHINRHKFDSKPASINVIVDVLSDFHSGLVIKLVSPCWYVSKHRWHYQRQMLPYTCCSGRHVQDAETFPLWRSCGLLVECMCMAFHGSNLPPSI